jgi:hypothetical protein
MDNKKFTLSEYYQANKGYWFTASVKGGQNFTSPPRKTEAESIRDLEIYTQGEEELSNDTKQLITFLLGQEQGEVIRAFKENRITKEQYYKRCNCISKAIGEVTQ